MKKFLLSVFLLVTVMVSQAEIVTVPIPGAPGLSVTVGTGANALPLQNIQNNPNATNITTWDDNYTNVPLGFDFPMFGQKFNNSWAMTNGMVTFKDPAISGIYGACCQGVDLTRTTDTRWNYSIFGVHTDLYSWNGQNQWYLRGNNEMTYGWYNISQCCGSQGGNSFEIKINSQGVIDTRIAGAMVQWNAVTSGFSGDLSKGEYYQYYHGQGWNITSANPVSWGAFGGTGAVDICLTNPLSSPSCPNYFTAQCTVSALYNPSCPGYAAAYFTQQCSANPLYDVNCPGYASAYLEYQCSVNPLYSTTCSGYQQAYHDQQCSINPLYASDCTGYQTAYHDQQCSINPLYATDCTGYATAYLNQQCSINPLYSTTCTGYAAAYKTQQCNLNQLYATDCPGYQQAYFNQQCQLNGLYDTKCPNYATAYATAEALKQSTATTTTTTTSTTTTTTTAPTAPAVESSGEVKVAVVADTNVNTVITQTATSASPAQAATATVPLVAPPATQTTTTAQVEAKVEAKQEAKEDKNAPNASVSSTQTASNSSSTDSKPAAPTARQELQARRQEAARAKAVESGKQLANDMGKAADMEQQKAVQNVVIQAMGFTPGFDAYGKSFIPDVKGYKPYAIYANQKTIDNRANLRMFGGTDKLHSEMVESQYNRGN